ncbi:Copper homeostasis protein CutC [Penicillium coprophilum]|uniref:Copper homeostasis protein CutC n=1 Tax=Penicillium coprophilum TaxID=36646 RepID=UPI002389ADD7|nr:Copper homeostasis protein CutC [Penicillium coprophilum]KAJ5178685.1 Copper homeostasis protein CutC [Penicillium coprophilum]
MSPYVGAKAPILEVACFNQESAVVAARAGADRVELCKDYYLGGLSPKPEVLQNLRSQITIPIYAMVRPHADGFCYKDLDFEVMKETLNSLKSLGADGFVFGILTESPQKYGPNTSWVDVSRNKQLVQLAEGRPCTFHRAFDLIPESHWETALADIRECGFASILTNGGPSGTKAAECIDKLQTLVRYQAKLEDHRELHTHKFPEIIVGGGVRASNIGLLHMTTGASAFHSAALLASKTLTCADEVFEMKDKITQAREK